MSVFVGTAGWSLPLVEQGSFPGTGSHLERYCGKFAVVEINSSFHRSHRAATWMRWRDSVPDSFRFSVKLPKTITHVARLLDADNLVAAFLDESSALGHKLGYLLVQLPPSLVFEPEIAENFFSFLRERTALPIACEPRHESWFTAGADRLLATLSVARVAADPARVTGADTPGGWKGLSYYRLHGWPKVYYSSYSAEFLSSLAARLNQRSPSSDTWVIFDNTTLGAATRNALDLAGQLSLPT